MTAITKARFMDGLVCWLPMAEGAGTRVNDQSLYGNNGVFGAGAAAPSWVAGRDGLPGVTFDGLNDYVAVPHSTSINLASIVSIISWIYIASGETQGDIIGKNVGINRGYGLSLYPGPYLQGAINGVDRSRDSLLLNELEWIMVGMSYTTAGGGLKLYTNGMEVSNYTFQYTGTNAITTAAEPMWFGRTVYEAYFDGIIGDTYVYNRILEPYEFRAAYEAVRKI